MFLAIVVSGIVLIGMYFFLFCLVLLGATADEQAELLYASLCDKSIGYG